MPTVEGQRRICSGRLRVMSKAEREVPSGENAGITDQAAALTIADAARAARTDRRAIRRLLDAGDLPNAFKDEQGFWRVPPSDLERAGLAVGDDITPQSSAPQVSGTQLAGTTSPAAPERPDPIELVLELAHMEARAVKAEALLEVETRLNQELRNALDIERQTLAALIGIEPKPATPEPRPAPARPNWQRELREARAREQQQRAARARDNQR